LLAYVYDGSGVAKIREEDIDALRDRADLVEIVSSHSRLKKSGGHTFKGLCPFHSEKTPSFTVDAAKGLWHCFGCGEGGDVYRFVEKVENLSFPEAAEWLARKTGLELHYEEMRPGERRAFGVKARIIAANEEAALFFHKMLMSSPEASAARRYLEARSFGRDVAERWRLGFAPGQDALSRQLLGRGFTHQELESAALTRRSERDGSYYDVFRNRITFPTWNLQGDVVGFGARALGDAQPKYLNSAETPAFAKARILYGLNRAKSAISRGVAVVVEGYTDVIALHEGGIQEAVATNGVALGESHFELLKKFTHRAVLMLDADEAGRGATERSFDILNRIGLEFLVAPLPPGRDPADVITEDGVDGIRKAIATARPLLEFKLDQALARLPLDTPEARSRAVAEAGKVLGLHPDPIARHGYVFLAADRIGVEPDWIRRALVERPDGGTGAREGGGGSGRHIPGHVKVEREALLLMLTEGAEVTRWMDQIEDSDFTSPARRELFRAARSEAAGQGNGASLISQLSSDASSLYTELAMGASIPTSNDLSHRVQEVFIRLRVFRLEREIKNRRKVLQSVNPVDDPDRHDELFTKLVGLEAERRHLIQQLQEVVG
jgi:DNA primase